jgi:hypothetical protein
MAGSNFATIDNAHFGQQLSLSARFLISWIPISTMAHHILREEVLLVPETTVRAFGRVGCEQRETVGVRVNREVLTILGETCQSTVQAFQRESVKRRLH